MFHAAPPLGTEIAKSLVKFILLASANGLTRNLRRRFFVRLQITSLLFVIALAQPVLADTLSLNDSWVVLDQDMSSGGFFTGSWSWSSSDAVSFRITDLFVASDQFKIYDFGVLVATTPGTPSWSSLSG